MNTRLQVEHPITEYITGVDLVEGMIRVAAGLPLNITQDQIKINGWAMESRVYAEDPYRNFLPSIGKLTTYKPPKGEGVRVDEGVFEGGEISIYYDPLICKLVTHGKTRDESVTRMKDALDSYVIRGVNHNIPFLRAVMENTRFLKGELSTKFIPEEFPGGFQGFVYSKEQVHQLAALAAAVKLAITEREYLITDQLDASTVAPGSLALAIGISHAGDKTDLEAVVTTDDNDAYNVQFKDGATTDVELYWDVGATVLQARFDGADKVTVCQVFWDIGII